MNKYDMKPSLLAKKIVAHGLKIVLRSIVAFLPDRISVFLGKRGYTEIIKRNESINFIGNVFNTKYQIGCQSNYAVERIATSRRFGGAEPFLGIAQLMQESFTMLDIGANIGAYSIGSVALGASKVYAVEPGPLFDRLLNNISINALQNKIYPVKIGLSAQPGKMRWYEDMQNPGNAHLVISKDSINFDKIPTRFGESYVEVEVVTLDALVRDLDIPRIDIIKIDVEGMEWEVISGGGDLIRRDLPIIVAETHRVASDMMRYDCMTPLFEYLYSLGYESYSFKDYKFTKFIYPNFELDTFFIPSIQPRT